MSPEAELTPTNKHRRFAFLDKLNDRSRKAVIFAASFAIVAGVYLLLHSFASTTVLTSIEAENMSPLPAGATIIQKGNASGGKFVQFIQPGTLSGQFNITSPAVSVAIYSAAKNCGGAYPVVNVKVDGNTVFSPSVKTLGLFSQDVNLTAGNHSFAIEVVSLPTSKNCVGTFGLDYFNVYGSDVTPKPTVSLVASPTSIASGASSTLTWSSTDAISCNASGAWTGSQSLSGSISTGALTKDSTYTLDCTGPGGTASATATVTVTAPPPPDFNGVSGPGIALPNKSAFRPDKGAAELDNAQQLGAKWVRVDLGYEHNSYYDALVSGITTRGMKVLAQMGSTGKAALGQAGTMYTPDTFLTVVNNEVPWYYAKGARDFEILNEPNLNGYSPDQYLAIVKSAYPRIKQLAPDARVWVGAVGIGYSARDAFNNFVKPMFPTVASYMDGFSIHAADQANPPVSGDRWWSMQAWTWGPISGDITDTIRSEMNNAGASAKPIILSEYNYPDNKPDLATQATRVAENICDTRYPGVANYTVMDDDVLHYGMLTLSLAKKPVWSAFQQAAAKLASGSNCP